MEKSTYYVQLNGCDDSTYLQTQLTADEFTTIKKIFNDLNKVAIRKCQPGAQIAATKPHYWEPNYEIESEQN